jgi:DNA-binding FadR family transcriptional regulator
MKIPNEFELADELNVGRGTIREAVKTLVTRNVLVIKRGNGTYVAENPGRVDDPLGFALNRDKFGLASDLCEVRLILEPEIAALAAQRATDEEIEKIRKYSDEAADAILACKDHTEADINFHKAIAAASHNQVMESVVPVIQQGIYLFCEIADESQLRMTIRTHRQICKAIDARDARAAHKAMRDHLLKNQVTFRIKTENAGI